ncbi:MAG: hypothetical protein ACP5G4_08385 [bacterium]
MRNRFLVILIVAIIAFCAKFLVAQNRYHIEAEMGLVEVPQEVSFNNPEVRIGGWDHFWKISILTPDTVSIFALELGRKKRSNSSFSADPLDSCYSAIWEIISVVTEDTNSINWPIGCEELRVQRTDSSLLFSGEITYENDIEGLYAMPMTVCGACDVLWDVIEAPEDAKIGYVLTKPNVVEVDSIGDGPDPEHDITFFRWSIEPK